jgi:peptide/nickel transport system permease protein
VKIYVVRKVFLSLITILIVMALNFGLMHAAPGSPVTVLLGQNMSNPEYVAAMTEKYGLDQPLHVQFLRYLSELLHGNLGNSIIFSRPVTEIIGEKILPTISLVLLASAIGLVLGTLMGMAAARKEGKVLDAAYSGTAYFLNAMPSFWLALMLIIIFSVQLGWFPTSGMEDVRANYTGFAHWMDVGRHMFLPLLTLVLLDIPYYFRIAKSSVIQVNNEDYIMTFKAAGMSERRIFKRYVLKNAILPVITVFGITMAYLIAGVALVEIVFAWPGTGRVMLTAITQRDYPVLMGIYLLMSIMVCFTMIAIDVIYAVLDPRIRYTKESA